MPNPFFYPHHSGVTEAVKDSDIRYVIIGPGGWLGRATVEYLADLLGEEAPERLLLLGSTARLMTTHAGIALQVHALAQAGVNLPQDRPCLLFHYAFLTMDKVGGMSETDYVARNLTIRQQVSHVVRHLPLQGLAVPSSGAIYDLIAPRPGRDPAANLYGRLKYEDEFYFEGLATALDISYVSPRVFNLSGPYINKPRIYALASFILDAQVGRDIEIRASHPVVRAYAPVQLLIELELLLLHRACRSCERFDFAGSDPVELGMLGQLVAEMYQTRIQRNQYQAIADHDVYVGNADVLKSLIATHQFDPFPTLKAQIAMTARYLSQLKVE